MAHLRAMVEIRWDLQVVQEELLTTGASSGGSLIPSADQSPQGWLRSNMQKGGFVCPATQWLDASLAQ